MPWLAPDHACLNSALDVQVIIEHSHGDPVEVTAGKAVYLAKGEVRSRVKPSMESQAIVY